MTTHKSSQHPTSQHPPAPHHPSHAAAKGKTHVKPHRYILRDGRVNVKRKGLQRHSHDWYHWMLALRWPQLILLISTIFLATNFLFAALYYLDWAGVSGAKPGSFADMFFFSVQTLGTLGYGRLAPESFYVNCVVTAESLVSLASIGMIAGLLFSRFSRPSARVMFSHFAVICPHEGKPTLMFRAANRRGNQILQAQIHVSLSRNEKTKEGETVRKIYDLKLLRSASSYFNLTWTIRHPIDQDSPFYGQTQDSLKKNETEIIVLLSGIDDVYGQTVHGGFSYDHEEILFNCRFANMFERDFHNRPTIDYSKFDIVEPV
jgi:inward rectifier potassium channel